MCGGGHKVIGTCGSYFGEVVVPVEDHPRFPRPPLQDAPRQSRQTEDHDDVDQGHEERVVEVLARAERWDSRLVSGIQTVTPTTHRQSLTFISHLL